MSKCLPYTCFFFFLDDTVLINTQRDQNLKTMVKQLLTVQHFIQYNLRAALTKLPLKKKIKKRLNVKLMVSCCCQRTVDLKSVSNDVMVLLILILRVFVLFILRLTVTIFFLTLVSDVVILFITLFLIQSNVFHFL